MAQRNRGSGQESSVGAQGKVQGRHPYFDLDFHLRPLHGTENPPRQCRKVVAGCGIGKKFEVEPLYKSGSVAELVQPAAQFNALSDTVPGLNLLDCTPAKPHRKSCVGLFGEEVSLTHIATIAPPLTSYGTTDSGQPVLPRLKSRSLGIFGPPDPTFDRTLIYR